MNFVSAKVRLFVMIRLLQNPCHSYFCVARVCLCVWTRLCLEMLYNPKSLVSTRHSACHRKEQEEIQNTVVVYL